MGRRFSYVLIDSGRWSKISAAVLSRPIGKKRYSHVRSAESPRPTTFIATLRGETEVGGAAIGLSSPSRTKKKEKRYAVSSRLLSPKGPHSNRQLTASYYPPNPQGR